MKRRSVHVALAGFVALCACAGDPEPALKDNPLCAFDCPTRGVAAGNAAISGVPSADTLFRAVVAYGNAADHASAALETEFAQLRADFGIGAKDALGAELRSQGADVLGQSPGVVAAQAVCWVDSLLLNDAQSQCDAEMEASETIECRGPCRVDLGTDCTVSAELQCTKHISAGDCSGKCSGTCTREPDPDGGCDGVCLGTCDGACDKYSNDADGVLQCAGRCAGRCGGQCARPVLNDTCRGSCSGACMQVNPTDGCDDAIEERCQSKSGRPFDCPGSCGGVFAAATGNAECRAAAQAQASYLARCDAPSISVTRAPASATPNEREQRYLRALGNFEQRLPELLANIARAKLIKTAGQTLAAMSNADVKESLQLASAAPELPIATSAGLQCAIAEAPRVGQAIEPSERRLDTALADADELLNALDID